MATTDNPQVKSRFRQFKDHLRHDWRATVFVACALFIVHAKTDWLDPFDNFAFALLGHPGDTEFLEKRKDEKTNKALVVLIDEKANETSYLDRSPLNRCQLYQDLEVVYSAMERRNLEVESQDQKIDKRNRPDYLDLLVIDLDISPALWLAKAPDSTAEKKCETDLYALIKDAAKKQQSKHEPLVSIRTVLMTPFHVSDSDPMAEKKKWLTDMAKSGVLFGFPELPVTHGWVNRYYKDPCALARTAYDSATCSRQECSTRAIKNIEDSSIGGLLQDSSEEIDPRQYRRGIRLMGLSKPEDKLKDPCSQASFKDRLDCALKVDSSSVSTTVVKENFRAVFFGAGFGEIDTFLTPLGVLYGVEVHAAAYLTLNNPLKHQYLLALGFDIAFAFFIGWMISMCWAAYFKAVSQTTDTWNRAPIYLLKIGAIVFVAICFIALLPWLLIHGGGIWISPIPIALGMLVESFVSASVVEASREIKAVRRASFPSVPVADSAAHPRSAAESLKAMSPLSRTFFISKWFIWLVVVCFAIFMAVKKDFQ